MRAETALKAVHREVPPRLGGVVGGVGDGDLRGVRTSMKSEDACALVMPMLKGHLDPTHVKLADDLNLSDASEAVRLDTITPV